MAFYEKDFIEIKRDNYKMEIVGILKSSVEQEDVRQYIKARVKKEKIYAVGGIIAIIVMWFIAVVPVLGELVWTSKSNPHLGPGTIILIAIFAMVAVFCTVHFCKAISASRQFIVNADPDSPMQLLANTPDALIWKQKKQWEICYAHDLVPLETAINKRPIFLSDGVNFANRMNATETSLRRAEEKQLIEYAASLVKSELLTVYLDIDKLGSGVYGFAAGKALGKAIPPSELEGISVSSGDSAASLNGAANEYAVRFSGDGSRMDRIETLLRADRTLTDLLSDTGLQRRETNEPLVADGTVRNGKMTAPAGHSLSFCAAGFNDAWKETVS